MAEITYILSEFTYEEACNGSLCAVIKKTYEDTIISNNAEEFIAVGFIKQSKKGGLEILAGGITYYINSQGECSNFTDVIIKLAGIYTDNSAGAKGATLTYEEGNVISGGTTEDTTIDKDLLNNTALSILNTMLSKASQECYEMSESQKVFYCNQAYELALMLLEVGSQY